MLLVVVGIGIGCVGGLVFGMRLGWWLGTKSAELLKRASEQSPEIRTICGQHDAYLDIAEEIERSAALPCSHTLRRIGSYARCRANQLCEQAALVVPDGGEYGEKASHDTAG